MKLSGMQSNYLAWGGLGLLALGVGYALIKWGIPAIAKAAADSAAKAAGSVSSGAANTLNAVNQGLNNNNLVSSQTDFRGAPTTAYVGHGPVGVLGAEANAISGGLFASTGDSIGSGLFSIFGPKVDLNTTTYLVTFPDWSEHSISSDTVDASGNFNYGGVRYRLGDDGSGLKIATPLTTIYGSGAG